MRDTPFRAAFIDLLMSRIARKSKLCGFGFSTASGRFLSLCVYHPPKPVYPVHTFISQLSDGIDSIISRHSDFIWIVAGDFNSLCTDFITNDFGLYQLVKSPTHEDNILDKVFVSMPDLYVANVFKSLVKTKHMCVTVEPTYQSTRVAHDKLGPQKNSNL
jgi:hypothetical protein